MGAEKSVTLVAVLSSCCTKIIPPLTVGMGPCLVSFQAPLLHAIWEHCGPIVENVLRCFAFQQAPDLDYVLKPVSHHTTVSSYKMATYAVIDRAGWRKYPVSMTGRETRMPSKTLGFSFAASSELNSPGHTLAAA